QQPSATLRLKLGDVGRHEVTGWELDDDERDHGYRPDRDDAKGDATCEVGQHACLPTLSRGDPLPILHRATARHVSPQARLGAEVTCDRQPISRFVNCANAW